MLSEAVSLVGENVLRGLLRPIYTRAGQRWPARATRSDWSINNSRPIRARRFCWPSRTTRFDWSINNSRCALIGRLITVDQSERVVFAGHQERRALIGR